MLKQRETVNALRGGLNAFLGGLTVFVSLLGLKALLGAEVSLRRGSTEVLVGSSAGKLEVLAAQLENQAKLIRQKDLAYSRLEKIYEQSLKGQKGYGKLQQAIEAVEKVPDATHIIDIKTEISAVEENLSETIEGLEDFKKE